MWAENVIKYAKMFKGFDEIIEHCAAYINNNTVD